MDFTPSKCQVVRVTSAKKVINSVYTLHGQILEVVTSARSLGVDISSGLIYHICINSLVPSVKKINIGNPGIQVNYWGGGGDLQVTWISNIGFCVPGNQQINANMEIRTPT